MVLFSKNKVIPVPLFILWRYWRTEKPIANWIMSRNPSGDKNRLAPGTSARSQHLHSALQLGGLLLQHDDVLPSQCDCISIISVSHRFIEAWCWAREDKKSQRHGCDVAFIHQHLHCSYSPAECNFFFPQIASVAALVMPQDYTQIFNAIPVQNLIEHRRAVEQIGHSAKWFSFLGENSPTSCAWIFTGDTVAVG